MERKGLIFKIPAIVILFCLNPNPVKSQSADCSEEFQKLISIGQEMEFKGDWAQAIDYFLKAKSEGIDSEQPACVASAYSALARVHATVGDFFNDLDDELRDKSPKPSFLQNINHYEQAGMYYDLSLTAAQKAQDTVKILFAKYGLAIISFKNQKYRRAIEEYSFVKKSFSDLGQNAQNDSVKNHYEYLSTWIINAKALALFEYGKGLSDTSKVLKAFADYKILEEIYGSRDNLNDLIGLSQNLSKVFFWLGEFDSALLYSRKVAGLIRDNGNIPLLIESKNWYHLGEGFEQLGQQDSALFYFKKYADSHEELFSKQQSGAISQFLVLYETEQKESTIREQERMILFGIVVLIFLVIISVYSIQKRRTTKKISDQKIDDLLRQQEIHSLQDVLAGQEDERKRIAGDLHDKLGAILGMVKLHFSVVEEKIDGLIEDNKKEYNRANSLLDQASNEVRNIAHNLMSGVLTKFGLIAALTDLKDTIEGTGKLKVDLDTTGTEKRLIGEQELQVYRIVQELLSNTLKHAKADKAMIELNRSDEKVTLYYKDNGIGFDFEVTKTKNGMGLKNLEARVNKLNGALTVKASKGRGTMVQIEFNGHFSEGNR